VTTPSLDLDPQPPTQRNAPSWLRAPQRVWLRRAIFQIHLWVGLIVAVYAVIIGLSGSILVFRNEIERTIRPTIYHLAPSSQQTPLAVSVQRIEAVRPGWRAFSLLNLDRPDQAVTLLMTSLHGSPTLNFRIVYFNPRTGEVLLDRMRYDGLLGWTINLHWYLFTGNTGLLISGWMALGLFILCITGVILWWPGIRRWASSLVLHPRSSWRRVNWDLHAVIGFWMSASLLAVTFTGLSFAFPVLITNLMLLVTGSSPHAVAHLEVPAKPMTPSTAPILTIDQAILTAHAALPSNAPLSEMQLPSKLNAPYSATGYYTETAPYSRPVHISLDPHTGSLLAYSDTKSQDLGLRLIQSFFAIHFGSFAGEGSIGLLVKAFWVLIGLTPALLGITGLLMYWNRKLRPLWNRMSHLGNSHGLREAPRNM
jgi:uncharacterized iron-regulated membrane protein